MRLIDADNMNFDGLTLNKSQMKAVLDFIDNQPTIENQLNDEWIPDADRLPERKDWYLISAKCGLVGEAQYIPEGKCFIYQGHYIDTYAWKPLPQPYKEATK